MKHDHWTADTCAACSEETHLDWHKVAWGVWWVLVGLAFFLAIGGLLIAAFGWQG